MKKSFVERLKELRGGLSQQEFCARIGVTQAAYCYWETGKKEPSYKAIKLICEACHVSSDWLLGLDVEGKNSVTASHSAVAINGDANYRDCSKCDLMKAAAKLLKK